LIVDTDPLEIAEYQQHPLIIAANFSLCLGVSFFWSALTIRPLDLTTSAFWPKTLMPCS
jgi:hypothetical protein